MMSNYATWSDKDIIVFHKRFIGQLVGSVTGSYLFSFSLHISVFPYQDENLMELEFGWNIIVSIKPVSILVVLFLSEHVHTFLRLWKQPFPRLNYSGPYSGLSLFQASKNNRVFQLVFNWSYFCFLYFKIELGLNDTKVFNFIWHKISSIHFI
jgi:hypothetical protein